MLSLQALQLRLCLKLPWLTRLYHRLLVITSLTKQACFTMVAAHLRTVRCCSPDLVIPQIASMCCPPWKAWKDSHLGKHPCEPAAQPWVVGASQGLQPGPPKCMIHSVTWSNQTSDVLVVVTAMLACPKALSGCCLLLVHEDKAGRAHCCLHMLCCLVCYLQLLLTNEFRTCHDSACMGMDELIRYRVGCELNFYAYGTKVTFFIKL